MRVCYKQRFTLGDFYLKFVNKPILVVGSGPTNYNYDKIKYFQYPVILVNNTINLAHHCQLNSQTFFFTLHIEEFWQRMLRNKHLIHVLPYEHMIIDPKYFRPRRLLNYNLRLYSSAYEPETNRTKIVMSNVLHSLENSMIPAIHFAYLGGCRKIYFVGCATKNGSYLNNHDSRLGGMGHDVPRQMRETLEYTCRCYNIAYQHIGL